MYTLFGLPSHPLFVHVPVVVIPVAALAAVILAFSPDVRRRLSGWLAGLTTVGFVGTFLADESGEALYSAVEERLGDLVETHEDLGEQTMVLVGLFFLATMLTAILDRFSQEDNGALKTPAAVLAVGSALLGVAASVWMIRTGHEGARLVWEEVLP